MTGDTHLGGDGGYTTGTLGTDTLLEGNVTDDGHEGVNHMTCTHEHGEEEGAEGSQKGNAVRVLAQQALSYLDEPVHTS